MKTLSSTDDEICELSANLYQAGGRNVRLS